MTTTVAAVTQAQSLAAIRNFVRASVSCITFARGLCNDDSFEQRPFLGMQLQYMTPTSPEAVTISEWIEKGAFDALNKHYLKEMALCVYNADCTTLLESYCFGFTYSEDGQRAQFALTTSQSSLAGGTQPVSGVSAAAGQPAMPAYRRRRCSKYEVQETLTAILTKLVEVVESLPPLLSERVLAMRLTYYDEVVPAQYEPPCFAPASEHMVRLFQAEQQHHVSVGSLDTSHHLFSVAIRHPLLAKVRRGELPPPPVVHTSHTTSQGMTPSHSGAPDESHFSAFTDTSTTTTAMAHEHSDGRVNASAKGRQQTTSVCGGAEPARSVNCTTRGGAHGGGLSPSHSARVRTARRGEEALRAVDVTALPALQQLVHEDRPLRVREVGYLVLVAFVLTHSPSAPHGRGRLSHDEVVHYLTESCPLSIAVDTALAVLQRMTEDGLVEADEEEEAGRQQHKSRRLQEQTKPPRGSAAHNGGSASGAAAATAGGEQEAVVAAASVNSWVIRKNPPLALLEALLSREQVTALLAPTDHYGLLQLADALREQARAPDKAARAPRVSCVQCRKRQKAS